MAKQKYNSQKVETDYEAILEELLAGRSKFAIFDRLQIQEITEVGLPRKNGH